MKQLKEKWLEALAFVVAFIALYFSCQANKLSLQANKLSAEANNISGTALAVSSIEVARQHTSRTEVNQYLAKSPDLLAEQDAQWINRRQLIPVLIKSQYWQTERSQYSNDSQKGYLFIFFINHGPGGLEGTSISDINWIPKKDQEKPVGLDGYLGVLPAGNFYAILVDVLERYDADDYSNETHFETLGLVINYKDELGREVPHPINMGNVRAGIPTPGPFNIEVP